MKKVMLVWGKRILLKYTKSFIYVEIFFLYIEQNMNIMEEKYSHDQK